MKKFSKIMALILVLAMSVTTLAACGGSKADSDWAEIQKKGKMVIGYTIYEPMNYYDDNNNFTGFDTEFANAVCAYLDITPEFVEINWDTKVDEIKAKSIDCIWNGMTISDELKKNISISKPYVKNMQVVVIKTDNADTYKDTASLKDKTIVAEAGSAGENVIKEDENLSQANYISVTRQVDALLEVKAGTSDAAVLDWTLAKAMIGEGTDYEELEMIDGVELSVEEYGIGFRKDSDTCDKVNEAIDALVKDGTLQKLAEKYDLSLSPSISK